MVSEEHHTLQPTRSASFQLLQEHRDEGLDLENLRGFFNDEAVVLEPQVDQVVPRDGCMGTGHRYDARVLAAELTQAGHPPRTQVHTAPLHSEKPPHGGALVSLSACLSIYLRLPSKPHREVHTELPVHARAAISAASSTFLTQTFTEEKSTNAPPILWRKRQRPRVPNTCIYIPPQQHALACICMCMYTRIHTHIRSVSIHGHLLLSPCPCMWTFTSGSMCGRHGSRDEVVRAISSGSEEFECSTAVDVVEEFIDIAKTTFCHVLIFL